MQKSASLFTSKNSKILLVFVAVNTLAVMVAYLVFDCDISLPMIAATFALCVGCFFGNKNQAPVLIIKKRFYKYGLRPIVAEVDSEGLPRYYAYQWDTGKFKEDMSYWRKIDHDLSGDAEELAEAEFNEYVGRFKAKTAGLAVSLLLALKWACNGLVMPGFSGVNYKV